MASVLFSPITLRGLTLPNRVVVSPMSSTIPTMARPMTGCVYRILDSAWRIEQTG
jgi:2,4-dienoyl-CoA reductase-like NADH-dependent reductase (Old Yellow Enzyme family)